MKGKGTKRTEIQSIATKSKSTEKEKKEETENGGQLKSNKSNFIRNTIPLMELESF